jgi:cytochrome P450
MRRWVVKLLVSALRLTLPLHPQNYKDFPRLERCLAVLYETLRLHPAVTIIPKMALEDTYLPDDVYPLPPYSAPKDMSTAGERPRVFIPRGTHVHIDTTALRELT